MNQQNFPQRTEQNKQRLTTQTTITENSFTNLNPESNSNLMPTPVTPFGSYRVSQISSNIESNICVFKLKKHHEGFLTLVKSNNLLEAVDSMTLFWNEFLTSDNLELGVIATLILHEQEFYDSLFVQLFNLNSCTTFILEAISQHNLQKGSNDYIRIIRTFTNQLLKNVLTFQTSNPNFKQLLEHKRKISKLFGFLVHKTTLTLNIFYSLLSASKFDGIVEDWDGLNVDILLGSMIALNLLRSEESIKLSKQLLIEFRALISLRGRNNFEKLFDIAEWLFNAVKSSENPSEFGLRQVYFITDNA